MDSKLLATILAVAIASTTLYTTSSDEITFDQWQSKWGRRYGSLEEESYRHAVWMANMADIKEHNDAGVGHIAGENDFTDLTEQEFFGKYTGYVAPENEELEEVVEDPDFELVGNVNWNAAGHVFAVKNQGSCGSCWAFAAIGAMESSESIFQGQLQSMSEQQANDCATGANGCRGGNTGAAYNEYRLYGTCSQSGYPYVARDQTCRRSSCAKISYTIRGHAAGGGSANNVMNSLNRQPMSICHQTGGWNTYRSGIFLASQCRQGGGHCTVLVGYTSTYWLVKNSWGGSWGESGYIRMQAPNNTCDFINKAHYPTI